MIYIKERNLKIGDTICSIKIDRINRIPFVMSFRGVTTRQEKYDEIIYSGYIINEDGLISKERTSVRVGMFGDESEMTREYIDIKGESYERRKL